MSVDLEERQTNVKNVNLETPILVPEFPFNPEEEIDDNHWAQVLTELEQLLENENWTEVLRIAGYAALLFPQRRSSLSLIDQQKTELIKYSTGRNTSQAGFGISTLTRDNALLKVLYPNEDHTPQSGLWTPDHALDYINRRVSNPAGALSSSIINFCLLYPDAVSKLHSLPGLQEAVSGEASSVKSSFLFVLAQGAAVQKMFFPDEKLHLQSNHWEELKNNFIWNRDDKHWDSALPMAFYLNVIAGNTKLVTDGLSLIQTQSPPIPTTKKF